MEECIAWNAGNFDRVSAEECYSYLEKIELKKKLLLAKKW
jgi:hypothetical protein